MSFKLTIEVTSCRMCPLGDCSIDGNYWCGALKAFVRLNWNQLISDRCPHNNGGKMIEKEIV